MKNILAQSLQISGTEPIQGPIVGINSIGDLVNKLVSILIPIGSIILFLVLVWGGYDYLLSRGDPEKLKGANAKITAGIIGFILLILSYFIVKLLSFIFGLGGGVI